VSDPLGDELVEPLDDDVSEPLGDVPPDGELEGGSVVGGVVGGVVGVGVVGGGVGGGGGGGVGGVVVGGVVVGGAVVGGVVVGGLVVGGVVVGGLVVVGGVVGLLPFDGGGALRSGPWVGPSTEPYTRVAWKRRVQRTGVSRTSRPVRGASTILPSPAYIATWWMPVQLFVELKKRRSPGSSEYRSTAFLLVNEYWSLDTRGSGKLPAAAVWYAAYIRPEQSNESGPSIDHS
jgi:hypothetical protein